MEGGSMSEISFNCPKCGVEIETDESFAGSVAQCPNCNSTVMIPMAGIKEGMKVAGYEIIRRLGVGGMGEVWLANQTSMGRKVALKILSPALTSDQEFVDRFLKEIQTAAKLEHQNIVTAFDAGVDGNIYYLAMSYVDGVLLDDLLTTDKRIPEKEALRIIRSIAEALCYAWIKFQMLHRDIKPANIMLDSDRTAKLMDMGISKSLSEEKGLTMAGIVVGTPYYMSPEQTRGDSDMDCRADIYSLGATLYHLVTGEVPYDAPTSMGILTKHITDPFPPPQNKNPEISDACAVLLEVMMAKRPEDRPTDWSAAIEDIDLVLSGKFPKTKRPAAGVSLVMQQMTSSQALSRRKVFKQPQKAKLTHKGEKAGAGDHRADGGRQEAKSSMPTIITVAAVLVLAVIIGGVVINNSKKAAAEKARIELLTRQKAEDDKRRIAEATKKAELEKQKAAESAAKLVENQQELWDATAKIANQALADKSNFEAAIAGLEKIKANCKGTKFAAMADNEIAKLAKAKNDADEEKRVKAEEEHASTSAKPTADKKDVNSNEEESARITVPSGDAVKAARAALRQTFKDEFSKKKNEDKLVFSKTLRETAATEKDAVQKYALFVEAIALATDAGNTDEAFAAVMELCVVFDAVSSKEKGIVLAAFAKKATKPEDFKILVDRYLAMVNEAMEDSDTAAASDLLKGCKSLATKVKDKGLSSLLSDKAKEIAALAAELKKLRFFLKMSG